MAVIVVLAHRVPFPPNKGEKLRTFHQIEELIRQGHSLKVVTPVDGLEDEKNAISLSEFFGIPVINVQLSLKPLRLLRAVLLGKSFSEANFYSKKLLVKFTKEVKNADIILLTASSLAPYIEKLPMLHGSKLFMDFMDVDSDKWEQYAKQSSCFKKLIYLREANKVRLLEKQVSERFSRTFVIAASEWDLFQSKVHRAENLKVLGNGIDQTLFYPSEEKSKSSTNFLFSGVMDYKPNVKAVLWFVKHCWPNIQKDVSNARFIIAGMSPIDSILSLHNNRDIVVTGFVDDIKPYFDMSHIFVAPFQIARGVQNKILQAMACAIPVVSTSLGAEGIICEHEKDILIANDALEFTTLAIQLANHEPMRRDIGSTALQTINDNYAWQSVLLPLTKSISKTEASEVA